MLCKEKVVCSYNWDQRLIKICQALVGINETSMTKILSKIDKWWIDTWKCKNSIETMHDSQL